MRLVHITTLLFAALLLVGVLPATAQSMPSMAGVTADGLVIADGGGLQVVDPGGSLAFSNLRWSQDGQWLLYSRNDTGVIPAIYRSSRGGDVERVSETGYYLPADFATDGSAILYAGATQDSPINVTDQGPEQEVTLYRQPMDLSTAPEVIGQIGFGVGCGGGSPFPMDSLYNSEAGFGGRGLTFFVVDAGIVYSANCAGVGLALFDPNTGETTMLGSTLSRAVLSPGRDRIAAVDNSTGGVVILNPIGGIQMTLSTGRPVDQLAWGSNDTLYYSSRQLLPEPLPLSEAEATAVTGTLGLAPDSIPQYQASVMQLNLSGSESLLFEQHAWAVGKLFASGGAVYFSLISNGEAWVEALANGNIDPLSPDSFTQARQSVPVTLMGIAPGGDAIEVAEGVYHAAPNPAG